MLRTLRHNQRLRGQGFSRTFHEEHAHHLSWDWAIYQALSPLHLFPMPLWLEHHCRHCWAGSQSNKNCALCRWSSGTMERSCHGIPEIVNTFIAHHCKNNCILFNLLPVNKATKMVLQRIPGKIETWKSHCCVAWYIVGPFVLFSLHLKRLV